eukprot:9377209-Prorocentrum_lima.AAC.1
MATGGAPGECGVCHGRVRSPLEVLWVQPMCAISPETMCNMQVGLYVSDTMRRMSSINTTS